MDVSIQRRPENIVSTRRGGDVVMCARECLEQPKVPLMYAAYGLDHIVAQERQVHRMRPHDSLIAENCSPERGIKLPVK